jgi:epsilon-lactone hydrolase
MASKQSYQLVELFRRLRGAIDANPDISIAESRSILEHMGDATSEPRGVDYIEVEMVGLPAMWAIPKNCVGDRVLLCAHVGGYISGSMYSHRKIYGHYAKRIGCRALIVNYRLAPENRHPGAVNDMAKAYVWLLDQGITPNHLAITGDSAGGALAITTMVRLRELGAPLPVASMPLSPWVDMEHTGKQSKATGKTTHSFPVNSPNTWHRTSWARKGVDVIRLRIRYSATCEVCPRFIFRPAASRPC